MQKLVSVIIPCYNAEQWLAEAIDSCLQQTYSNTEIIIIDDGSTDGSLEIIRTFGNHQISWEAGPNQGAPSARNRGLELAQGEFVKFLDADDILLPDCIERQVAQAANLPSHQKAIVYGDAIWVDRDGSPLSGYPHRPRYSNEDLIAHILEQSPLTSCPLHKREYLLEIGGFDPLLPRSQEHDLHLRLTLAGVEFIYHTGSVYKYREYTDAGRLSNHPYSQKGPLVHFQILCKQRNQIEEQTGKPLSVNVRKILSQHFWAYGRGILREGFTQEANQYFEAARLLDANNCIKGNPPYPMFVKLLGPQLAELLADNMRALKCSASS